MLARPPARPGSSPGRISSLAAPRARLSKNAINLSNIWWPTSSIRSSPQAVSLIDSLRSGMIFPAWCMNELLKCSVWRWIARTARWTIKAPFWNCIFLVRCHWDFSASRLMMITEFMWHRWLLSLSMRMNGISAAFYIIILPSIALPFVTLIFLSLFVSWAKGDSILLYYIDDDKRFFTCCCFFYSTHCVSLCAIARWRCECVCIIWIHS